MSEPAVDMTGWSKYWRARYHRASPGLSVPRNTPRGASERRFLALFDDGPLTFRRLCELVAEPPNKSWDSVEKWVRGLLYDLKRVESLRYDKEARHYGRTPAGAAVADADAEWVLGGIYVED